MKKITAAVFISLLLAFSCTAFEDVPESAWFYEDVNLLSGKGIITGYPDGLFHPGDSVSVAEFCRLFAEAVGESSFAAVPGEPWYTPYINYCIELGVMTETDDYNRDFKKIEIAKMLGLYYDELPASEHMRRLAEDVSDFDLVGEANEGYVLALMEMGIIIGHTDGYHPESSLTRAEAATIISRMLDDSRRRPCPIPVYPVDYMSAAETSGQIITVTVAEKNDYHAKMNVYEQSPEGLWQRMYKDVPAVTGGQGIMYNRKQNTYKSPAGDYGFVFAFGIMDNPGVSEKYEYRKITDDSYWVLDSDSILYNSWVEGKGDFDDAEHMIDFGYQYNYGMVIDFNYGSPVKGDGGAIFLHVATEDGKGTGGCIGIAEAELVDIMKWLDPDKNPRIIICQEGELENF